MLTILIKLFIDPNKGDNRNYSNPAVRQKYGVLCGWVGIFFNILLFFSKFVAGTLASSVALVADAFNNLSDAASSIIQILGFKLAGRKPDPEHPFGHGRLEYVAGLIISFLVLLMGFELLKSSILSIVHPEKINLSVPAFVIMVVAIFVKLYMMAYNLSIAKRIDSVAMKATATDSLSDAVSTLLVLLSFVVGQWTDFPVDGLAGIVVACLILKGGWESARETLDPLLGRAPSPELVKEIEEEVLKHKPIVGIHDLLVHDYGPGRMMISLHAEVPGNQDIFELHDSIDLAEIDVSARFHCQTVIHMDPIDTENKRLAELKDIIFEECRKIDFELKAHDIRMVPGVTHTNLIFDIVRPFSLKMSDSELVQKLSHAIGARCKDVMCVITVDLPFAG